MKKLVLDDLSVETFDTSGGGELGYGTVKGNTGYGQSCMRYCFPQKSDNVDNCGGNDTINECVSVNNYTCNTCMTLCAQNTCVGNTCNTYPCGQPTCAYLACMG